MVEQLQAQVKALQAEVRDLKARLNTHSGNSSLPPSANPPGAPKPPPKPPTGRKSGGQPGHPGHTRPRLPPERVGQVIHHVPKRCEQCGADLPANPAPDEPEPVWAQVAELPSMAAAITEHQAHGCQCGLCGHVTWAHIPADVLAHGFGPRLSAAVVFLSGRCHGSKRLVAEIVQTLFDVPISVGSICNIEAEASAALAPAHAQAEQAVRAATVKNADETGWSLAGKLCWLWMAATQAVAFFKICAGRGRAGFRELLGESFNGILCTDRWGAYNSVALAMRQLCWAHLTRDFQKWLDRGGEGLAVGRAGLEAVKQIFALWRDFRLGRIDRPGLRARLEPVCSELHAALETGSHCADKRVRRFCRNILEVYPALWTFARAEGVEPTNNHAERTLRLAVIWRKICFGNHSEAGCRFTERILTVVQTLRLQKRNVMSYLEQTFTASRAGQASPALIPTGV
jgi:transposase